MKYLLYLLGEEHEDEELKSLPLQASGNFASDSNWIRPGSI